MLLRVQAYDLLVKYKPSKFLYIADTLSRASMKIDKDDFDEELCAHINNLPVSDIQL